MNDYSTLFKGKRVTVMGLGLLGRGLGDTRFLVNMGARVTVTDLKTASELAPSLEQLKGLPIKFRLGEHIEEDFIQADMILRNADVPRSSPFLALARERGIPVEMDESLFCKLFSGKVVGVTGTRGKTTTTTLLYRILLKAGLDARLGGNIMGAATLPLLEEAHEDSIIALELSSWQLQGFHDSLISPGASIFTNIYPDHLNRYSGMEEYIKDKKAIYQYQKQGEICVFNGEQPESAALAKEAPAETAFFRASLVPDSWKIRLPGRHNLENIAAASTLAEKLGVEKRVIREAVEEFPGVEHRLQPVGEWNGVIFYNDTTSTTPVSGVAAINALDGRRILLIAGGADKKLDLTPFAQKISEKTAHVALLEGTATPALQDAIKEAGGRHKIIGNFNNLKDAVHSLCNMAQPGDVILLSPGAASFGIFSNEFHRGSVFLEIVSGIISAGGR
jgi:UDP-N-acetylmuramoylalanine--D-glutamate ligase